MATTPSGEVQTVQYNKINAMLLNEVQKQVPPHRGAHRAAAALEKLLASAPK
ncbi:MAG: hypothetical protein U0P30_11070 [Vicinamibacterales bacterium]